MGIEFYFKKLDIFGKKINMTFEGVTIFKTCCGACATLFMALLLLIIFIKECILIYGGELAGSSYMIKNKLVINSDKGTSTTIKDEILGFAFADEKFNNKSILTYKIGYFDRKNMLKFDHNYSFYDCSDQVYSSLNVRSKDFVPLNLNIKCVKVPSHSMINGIVPSIHFIACQNEPPEGKIKDGNRCLEKKILDEKLEKIKVFAFTMADESDFTMSETNFKSKFTAEEILISNLFEKRNTLVLREVEIHIETGIIFKKISSKKGSHMMLRNEEKIISFKKGKNIATLRLKIDGYSKVVITKTFKSYSDAIAFMGGFSKSISIFLMILVWPVREVLFYKKLLNQMFSVCVDKKQVYEAFNIMVRGRKQQMNNWDGETNDDPQFRESKTIDLEAFKEAVDINDGEQRSMGLMDEIAEGFSKTQYEKKMREFLEKHSQDGKNERKSLNLGDLFTAGLSFKGKLKKSGVKLGVHNLNELELISTGLKGWMMRAKKRLMEKRKSRLENQVEEYEEKENIEEKEEIKENEVESIKKEEEGEEEEEDEEDWDVDFMEQKNHRIDSLDLVGGYRIESKAFPSTKKSMDGKSGYLRYLKKKAEIEKIDKQMKKLEKARKKNFVEKISKVFLSRSVNHSSIMADSPQREGKNLMKKKFSIHAPNQAGGGSNSEEESSLPEQNEIEDKKSGKKNQKKKIIKLPIYEEKRKNSILRDKNKTSLTNSTDDKTSKNNAEMKKRLKKGDFLDSPTKRMFERVKTLTLERQKEEAKNFKKNSRLENLKKSVGEILTRSKKLYFYAKIQDFFKLWIPPKLKYRSKTNLFTLVIF